MLSHFSWSLRRHFKHSVDMFIGFFSHCTCVLACPGYKWKHYTLTLVFRSSLIKATCLSYKCLMLKRRYTYSCYRSPNSERDFKTHWSFNHDIVFIIHSYNITTYICLLLSVGATGPGDCAGGGRGVPAGSAPRLPPVHGPRQLWHCQWPICSFDFFTKALPTRLISGKKVKITYK